MGKSSKAYQSNYGEVRVTYLYNIIIDKLKFNNNEPMKICTNCSLTKHFFPKVFA